MTNEEAKALFEQSVAISASGNATAALALLDQLEAERPNSRNVTLQRGVCLAQLGRVAEAEECRKSLEGRIEPERMQALAAAITGARDAARASHANPVVVPMPDADNVLLVESVFLASTEEAAVTGHVRKGAFRVGDQLSVTTPEGDVVPAPIVRIGPAETPLQLVRAGQQAVFLLRVEPHLVAIGSYLSSTTKETAYAATMMVSTARPSVQEAMPEDVAAQVGVVEKLLRQRNYVAAREALAGLLASSAESGAVQRTAARVFLEAEGADRDAVRALEHAKRAYELGGSDDPAVVGMLAEAEAANGQAAQGLRFLERLIAVTLEPQARAAQAVRLTEFREKHGLGHVWEFSDQYGGVLTEVSSLAEAAKALGRGVIPRDGKVRKDRISEWQPIEQALGGQSPEIAALFRAKGTGKRQSVLLPVLAVLIVVVLGAAAWVFTR